MNSRVCGGRMCRRGGLTLIELMAALVLLAVLLTALLGLVPRFSRQAAARDANREVTDLHWTRVALERLASDLVNAQSAKVTGDTLELTGRLARDPNTGLMTDREDRCSYRFSRVNDCELLVREQAGVNELLGCGRVSIVVEAADNPVATEPLIALPFRRSVAAAEPLNLVPRMRVSIRTDAPETLATVLVVRQAVYGNLLGASQVKP